MNLAGCSGCWRWREVLHRLRPLLDDGPAAASPRRRLLREMQRLNERLGLVGG